MVLWLPILGALLLQFFAGRIVLTKRFKAVTELKASPVVEQKPEAAHLVPVQAHQVQLKDSSYYGKCAIGGSLACGLTHTAVVWLDLHKSRAQAYPKEWPKSMTQGLAKMWEEGGLSGCFIGAQPTLVAYGIQGLLKFGLNEFFSDHCKNIIGGAEKLNTVLKKIGFQALMASLAEVFADIGMCPWEMTRLKQLAEYPPQCWANLGFFEAVHKMIKERDATGFPFRSLGMLMGRQVPYTILKFVCFYQTAEFIYNQLEQKFNMSQENISSTGKLGITFGAGYAAGVVCATLTHPMDTLLSMAASPRHVGKTFGQMITEVGYKNLFTKGVDASIVKVGTLTGLQWWIYATVRAFFGLGTP